jgi:hypothetical protein
LSAPAVRAQRSARVSAGIPATTSRHISGPSTSGRFRTSQRSANNFFGSSFAGTNLFPGGAVGVNGINAIMAPGNIGTEAAIDPATQWNLALAQRVLRNTRGIFPGGGVYLLSGGGAYAVPEESGDSEQTAQPQQQPQVIVLQQASPVQRSSQDVQEAPSAPLPDSGQFTLVLRDGKQIEAVAFTHMEDRIVYITVDGSRRTIARTDLDADATIRLNQERGTPLQLPL